MRKPAAFLAHGSPMSALGGDAHAAALGAFGDKHPDARGILIISAHWQVSRPLRVTAWDHMPLLYDFGGVSHELYPIQKPSPGDPRPAAPGAGGGRGLGARVRGRAAGRRSGHHLRYCARTGSRRLGPGAACLASGETSGAGSFHAVPGSAATVRS